MEDDEDDDNLDPDNELTPEEEAQIEQQRKLFARYPTFVLLRKVLMKHARYRRLAELECPEKFLKGAREDRERAFDELCEAFPRGDDVYIYWLEDVIGTLRNELIEPHDSSKTDA